jgi:hypothetical protein
MNEQPQLNPLLQRAMIPGQTFALPSGGVFYKNGELDESVNGGELIVSPMVTMDEIIIKTPDKVLNGTSIVEVFARCIPQVKKPMELLAKDVDFLLVCLRKVTYGQDYEITYTHDCEDAKQHSYIVPLDPLISAAKKIDASTVDKDYTYTFPNSQVVKLTPPRYFQMLQFYQTFNTEVTREVAYDRMMDATVSLVEKVDATTDKEFIRQWATKVPAGYTRKLGERVAELSTWGPDLTSHITCRDCEKDVKIDISLNPMHFFS